MELAAEQLRPCLLLPLLEVRQKDANAEEQLELEELGSDDVADDRSSGVAGLLVRKEVAEVLEPVEEEMSPAGRGNRLAGKGRMALGGGWFR